jgi:hypothetical protein
MKVTADHPGAESTPVTEYMFTLNLVGVTVTHADAFGDGSPLCGFIGDDETASGDWSTVDCRDCRAASETRDAIAAIEAAMRQPPPWENPDRAPLWFAALEEMSDERGVPRGPHAICEAIRRANCRYCCALPGEACASLGTGQDGYHVARFVLATQKELITSQDLSSIFEAAVVFTNATVVYDEKPGGAS